MDDDDDFDDMMIDTMNFTQNGTMPQGMMHHHPMERCHISVNGKTYELHCTIVWNNTMMINGSHD